MPATMKDIAKKTGLGLATISKYLNGGHVLEKNRIVIEQAIEELNFTVNEFARGLKTSKSKTIGVVIPELSNVFITSIITVMEDILRQKGYGVLVCDSRTDMKLEQEAVQFLMNKMVDGIILMSAGNSGSYLEPVLKRGIPVLLIDRMLIDLEEKADMVLVDNFHAAQECTQYLVELGHEKIGIIVGPKEIYTCQQRLLGYNEVLARHTLLPDEKLVEFSDYTIQGGYEAMKRLIKQNPKMTAVFVTNYETTVGAVLAVNELGIRVPEELSMIGFDNLELAKVVKPKLTIVEQPLEQIGYQAAKLMLERLSKAQDQQSKPQKVVLDAKLQEGNSVLEIAEF